ncbi:MAG: 5-deoxyglucuronate isomerase, partial [Pseudorhodobacter sp.]|nr:5-deoxyglucuronate isomerase [Pseudorhodobacter sp.]
MHIAPYANRNAPVVAAGHPLVPLVYFNIVHLARGESFTSVVPLYETCIVP